MRRIALVTCPEYPSLTADDRRLLEPLKARGLEGVPACWSDPAVRWEEFAAIVIRSPWDYTERLEAFRGWLDRVEHLPLFNPGSIVRWNLDKHYLADLEGRGIPIVPTLWETFQDQRQLGETVIKAGWREAVVKPVVSAGARNTYRFRPGHSNAYRPGLALMVQPFLDAIASEGEWSLVYLGGRFSHAAVKRPAAGDFRVQEELGGTTSPASAPTEARELGDRIVAELDAQVLYARIDLVRWMGRLRLLELEVFEPALYFFADERSPERMAEAIRSQISA